MQIDTSFFLGAAVLPAAVFLVLILRRILITVPEGHEALQLRFGKLHRRITAPGLVGSTRLIPYDRWIVVSRQGDERVFRGVETNDAQGTMVRVDLRITFRIRDSELAMFAVHDWEQTLESTTVHEASAALAGKDRALFLRSAPELSQSLTEAVKAKMAAYGIDVETVRLMNVEFRPEVARQMFEAVAARLEVAKAEYEERGRTDAALLLAQTEERVAELEARAKTESLKAVGRAYQALRERPEIFEAYTELYRLSQLDPSRIVSFDGFEEGALSTAALVESDLEHHGHADGHGHSNGHGPGGAGGRAHASRNTP
jgi:regulator of protease activity HflC (stomatin/prohibitin superfamily)